MHVKQPDLYLYTIFYIYRSGLSNFHVYSDFDGNVSHLSESAETFPELPTSLGTTTSKRDRQASSSLSSGLMPESEDPEEFLESAVHEQVCRCVLYLPLYIIHIYKLRKSI